MKPKAKTFYFLGYHVNDTKRQITFNYQIDFVNRKPLNFTETILLPKAPRKLSHEVWRSYLEPLHLILGISYYKLYCPKKIKISFTLSKEQAVFWNTVYRKGLGEFCYRNHLNPEIIAKFPYGTNVKTSPVSIEVKDRMLLGIGGGKDSIVAAELLRDFDVTSFLVESQRNDPVADGVIRTIGYPSLKIRRILDKQIFMPHEGAYNGHIPISAVFAFLGLFSAAVYGYQYVVVGNEHSSNFGNLTYCGEQINHQWSKSIEFEAMFQSYTKAFITKDIVYFSLLRQFYEIRVVELFAKQKKYFPVFSSCNRNVRIFKKRPETLWCGECPKCGFLFLMLSAFLPKREVIGIFKKNLFADEKLLPLFKDLLGFGNLKPFDCVGTFEESQAALYLASKRFRNDLVVKTYLPNIRRPDKLISQVFRTAVAPTLPTPFRFLGIKNVCILGYGKEGKTTEVYIKKTYPSLRIGILDEQFDKDYLAKQSEYDLAVKTPGIPVNKVAIPYVTATNIFFSQNTHVTIGVTGSKGKSTTSTLIYELLKAAGKKVRLIGNIGKPMLGVLLEHNVDPKEIFVIEFSSYMLEDIEYSPNVAVLLNLFPEHMDHHGGLAQYYKAKERIFAFQNKGDLAFRFPFSQNIPLTKSEIPLLGKHNLKNIKAALSVARSFGVKDKVIKKTISQFKALPHRLERVGTFNGITFYDDAISTAPESTIMAITSLKKIGTIFLGGTDRGYDFTELEKIIRSNGIKNIVLFPDSGKRILKSDQGLTVLRTNSMKKAVEFAYTHTPSGQICLLSTASPSYSLWKNFEEKGDEFKKYVHEFAKSILKENDRKKKT